MRIREGERSICVPFKNIENEALTSLRLIFRNLFHNTENREKEFVSYGPLKSPLRRIPSFVDKIPVYTPEYPYEESRVRGNRRFGVANRRRKDELFSEWMDHLIKEKKEREENERLEKEWKQMCITFKEREWKVEWIPRKKKQKKRKTRRPRKNATKPLGVSPIKHIPYYPSLLPPSPLYSVEVEEDGTKYICIKTGKLLNLCCFFFFVIF